MNIILVIPRRSYEPLFSGIINIEENDWRIHSTDLSLTAKQSLEFLDTLHITQYYVPINNNVWQVKNQVLHFASKIWNRCYWKFCKCLFQVHY